MSKASHEQQRQRAMQLYKDRLDAGGEGEVWDEAVRESRAAVEATLKATNHLKDIVPALRHSGAHVEVLRFMMAPPMSQDQFKLACSEWSKSTERSGTPLGPNVAKAVASQFHARRDRARTDVLLTPHDETQRQRAIDATCYMMAHRKYQTERRNLLAAKQEQAACDVLGKLGYQRQASVRIDQPGILRPRNYMHKTLFATADGSAHEVDIAVALKGGRILALECKVSNDATNSVKRINDVLKKAKAWKDQWGEFVRTGALLEGVFGATEPRRLQEANVEVFWSHDLGAFREWIQQNM